jgi:MFS family permease
VNRGERRVVGVTTYLHGLIHGNLLVIPLLLPAWMAEFRVDALQASAAAAVAFALFGVGSVPFGDASDRRGAPVLLAFGLAALAAGLALASLAPTLPALALALALVGLGSSVHHPAALALISRAVRATGRGMGWHGMGGSLGIAVGPAVAASLLAVGVGWRSVLGLYVAPTLLGLLLLRVSPLRDPVTSPANRPRFRSRTRTLLTPAFSAVLVVYVFAGVAYWGALTILPQFLEVRVGNGGVLYAALLVVGAAGQVAGGYLADRRRPEVTLALLSAGVAAALLLMPTSADAFLVLLALAFGFVLFGLEPLQNVLVTGRAPAPVRGLAFGMTFLAVFGVGSVGAVLAGYFASQGEAYVPLFVLLGAAMATSGLAAWTLRRSAPPKGGR